MLMLLLLLLLLRRARMTSEVTGAPFFVATGAFAAAKALTAAMTPAEQVKILATSAHIRKTCGDLSAAWNLLSSFPPPLPSFGLPPSVKMECSQVEECCKLSELLRLSLTGGHRP